MFSKVLPAILLVVIIHCSAGLSGGAELQDLDEAMVRKSRVTSSTHYSGEQGEHYFWQPETLMWADTATGHEMWRITYMPNGSDVYSKEYSTRAFSADGSIIQFFDYGQKRLSGDPGAYKGSTYRERWLVRTDGTMLRAGGHGHQINDMGSNWLNTENSYLFSPYATEFSGAQVDAVYKGSIDQYNGVSYSLVYDFGDSEQKMVGWAKDCIASDDSMLWTKNYNQGLWGTPNNIATDLFWFLNLEGVPSVISSWGYARGFGPELDPYNNHLQVNEVSLKGASSYLLPFSDSVLMQDGGEGIIFQAKITGTYADGGPVWADWDGDSFGANEEIKALADNPETSDTPHNPYGNGYPGHMTIDRWGRYASVGSSQSPGDAVVWGDGSGTPGRVLIDLSANAGNPPWVNSNNSGYIGYTGTYNYAGHASWTAWSDYTVFNYAYYPDNINTLLQGNYYTNSAKAGDNNYRAADTIAVINTPLTTALYEAYPRPSQSPDGTKVAFSSILFHSDYNGTADGAEGTSIAYAVAYYPHPPEITRVTGSETYTIRFDWRTDQSVSRGYTQRGWPDEATNDPPPPRETKLFRLWRSANGTSGWVPVSTVNAEIFSRYNFATGSWAGSKYWDVNDTPGPGTWYYAVTAQEHSGLESRSLSNVFSTAGVQTAAYPSDPKGDSDFTTVYNPTIVRHYNIYAADGAAPTATQQDRIASIPVASAGEYVDWLGDTAGTTQYLVTAVDTQGNESGAIDGVARTALATPGQYKVAWDVGGPPGEPADPPGQARRLSLAGSLIKIVEPGP